MATEKKDTLFPKVNGVGDCWCYTDLKVASFSYVWTINNFPFCCPPNDDALLKSPPFSSGSDREVKWCLKLGVCSLNHSAAVPTISTLHVGGLFSASQSYQPGPNRYSGTVSLKLVLTSQHEVTAKFKFSLSNNREEVLVTTKESFVKFVSKGTKEHGFDGLIKCDDLVKKLPDGKLIVCCEVSAHLSKDMTNLTGSKHPAVAPQQDLTNHLGSALEEGLWSDFTIVVGEKKFKVHKFMLATRSPVFRKMIESSMKESVESYVEISDFSKDVVHEMLRFIYTGDAPNVKSNPQDMLSIADKYELDGLKALCIDALNKSLTTDNAVDTLLLADLHCADQLRATCMDFIITHLSKVNYIALKDKNRELYLEILETMAPPVQSRKA